MGCCGAKEQDQGGSFVGGRTDNRAVAPVATIMLAPEQRLAKRAEERAAPVMAPMEEQASKRAAQLERLAALPEHLRLGVTLPGMHKLLAELPGDAVEQVNANIPLDKVTGKPKFPKNLTYNGYANQFFITKWAMKEPKEEVKERSLYH